MPINPFETGFDMISLTASIQKLPHIPRRLQEMGLFTPKGITTTVAQFEEQAGTLTLIANSLRGGPAALHNEGKRTMRSIVLPHLQLEDRVLATDVQDIRAFGSEDTSQAVASVVNDHLQLMRDNHDATHEHLRIGAIHGNILDADNSTVMVNLFTLFGVSETTVNINFGTDETRSKITEVVRKVENILGGSTFDHVHFFCGDDWWDAFIDDADVKTAFDRWEGGRALRDDMRKGFPFAGAVFENYRGSVGGTAFITSAQARAFPVGMPGLFQEIMGPADFSQAVNTVGQIMYAAQEPLKFDRGIELHTQSNVLPICHRPATLVKMTKS